MNKLLILDVDGVMTDGTKAYGSDGIATYKRFCDLDFTGIKLFWARGWKVCFLTSDQFNEGLARQRGIDFYCSRLEDGSIDKLSWLSILKDAYGCEYCDITYIGDDIMDAKIMDTLRDLGGNCYCPSNAAPYMLRSFPVLPCKGGDGVVMTLYDKIYADNCDLREFCH